MNALKPVDRDAVLLRFFENRSLMEVGTALGVSEDAARVRVKRALEQLRSLLARHGVKAGAASIAGALAANAAAAAPASVTTAVLTSATAQAVITTTGLLAKGLWKPLLKATPFIGSVFCTLAAELECARSPRERKFLARMICLRFSIAGLLLAALWLCLWMKPSSPDSISIGVVISFFCVAAAAGMQKLYFHRRHREIQMEEGTGTEFKPPEPNGPEVLADDLAGKSTRANQYAALSVICGIIGCVEVTWLLAKRAIASHYWIVVPLLLVWSASACYRGLHNWRRRYRLVFDPRMRWLIVSPMAMAMMSLGLFDLCWASGRLHMNTTVCLIINLSALLAYAGLIKLLIGWHKNPIRLKQSHPTCP
jgi:hypothetical protein